MNKIEKLKTVGFVVVIILAMITFFLSALCALIGVVLTSPTIMIAGMIAMLLSAATQLALMVS